MRSGYQILTEPVQNVLPRDSHLADGLLSLQILRQSAFIFEDSWALVVPGSSEGVYGFVAANYASGALQKWTTQPRNSEAIDFWGVLELGGASLQVRHCRTASKDVTYTQIDVGVIDIASCFLPFGLYNPFPYSNNSSSWWPHLFHSSFLSRIYQSR